MLFAAALPGTLFAGTVTFSFDGIVYSGWGAIPNNAPMHGTFSYDSSVAPTWTSPSDDQGHFDFTAQRPASLSLTLEGTGGPYTFTTDLYDPQPYINVYYDWYFNGSTYQSDFQIVANISSASWPQGVGLSPSAGDYGVITLDLAGMNLPGQPGMVSGYTSLPTSLNNPVGGYGWIYPNSQSSDGFSYNPLVETLQQTTESTPEPGTELLLGGGLCALVLLARRLRGW